MDTYKDKGIRSIAFPVLGTNKGGIPKEESPGIMQEYLKNCDIKVEIYEYDPNASDEIYEDFKSFFYEKLQPKKQIEQGLLFENSESDYFDKQIDSLSKKVKGVKRKSIEKLIETMKDPSIKSLSALLAKKNFSNKTMEKIFSYYQKEKK